MLQLVSKNWSFLLWSITTLIGFIGLFYLYISSIKCSLRNDILTIYDQCRIKKEITLYQKQAIHLSADLYFKLKGNSFVKSIVEEIDTYKVV